MVKLRLSRAGSKKKPYYHIVVMDSRNKRDGKYIEKIGVYDPIDKNKHAKLDEDRLDYWYKCGAKPSNTVLAIINRLGIKLSTK